MKRLHKIIGLVLSVLLLFALVACGTKTDDESVSTTEMATEAPEREPESAAELWEMIDTSMNAVQSYELRSVMQFTYYYMGYKIDASAIAGGVYWRNGEEYYSYENSRTDMSCFALLMNESIESVEAYYDGKMYLSNTDGESSQKFCSPMTYEEYKEDSDSLLEEFDLLDCTNKEFTKGEDGTWGLHFSGYTKKAINVFLEESGMTEEDLGVVILDMELDVEADSGFHATKILIDLVFDTEEDSTTTPILAFECEYKGFNSTEPNYDELKTDEYTEIDDVRILKRVDEGLKDIKNAKTGDFSASVTNTLTAFGEDTVYTETDTVTFGEENGAYTYEITLKSSEGDGTIAYKNGVQQITFDSEEYSQAQTDKEAREFVYSLIDIANYDDQKVSGVEKAGENVYVLKVDAPDSSEYTEYFESLDVEYESAQQTITVTMSDESILKMESYVEVTGVYNDVASTEPVTLTVVSSVDFGETHDDVQNI